MFCANCGKELNDKAVICTGCGCAVSQISSVGEKGFIRALLLCVFLGIFGAHRFYVGKIRTGILMLLITVLSFGFLTPITGVWALVDLITIITGSFKDKNGMALVKDKKKDLRDSRMGCLIIFIIFLLVVALESCNNEPISDSDNMQPVNKNFIAKSSFKGEWAFTTDTAELYCVDLGGGLTGAKVYINGRYYAVTRNISKLQFLPYDLWADAKMEGLLCDGVLIDKKCKVSLADTVNYADTLCE